MYPTAWEDKTLPVSRKMLRSEQSFARETMFEMSAAPCPILPHQVPASGAPVGWNLLYSWEACQIPPISRAFLLFLNGVVQNRMFYRARSQGLLPWGSHPGTQAPPLCRTVGLTVAQPSRWLALAPGQRADARETSLGNRAPTAPSASSPCRSPCPWSSCPGELPIYEVLD